MLYVATANSIEHIHTALLDRMEVVEMSGYDLQEKVAIAAGHLLPRQLAHAGLPPAALDLPRPTLEALVERYTREAGVRNLERQIGAICRSVAVRAASLPTQERAALPPEEVGQTRAVTGVVPVSAPLRAHGDESARFRGPWQVGEAELEGILGPARYEHEGCERLRVPGVAMGLAWTPTGGELLFVEALLFGGTGQLVTTGSLGQVVAAHGGPGG